MRGLRPSISADGADCFLKVKGLGGNVSSSTSALEPRRFVVVSIHTPSNRRSSQIDIAVSLAFFRVKVIRRSHFAVHRASDCRGFCVWDFREEEIKIGSVTSNMCSSIVGQFLCMLELFPPRDNLLYSFRNVGFAFIHKFATAVPCR